MNQFDIKVGKLYRLQKGISCWDADGYEILNNTEEESIVMILCSLIQRDMDIGNSEFSVLLETGEIGWIYDYNFNRMELIEE